MDLSNFDLAAYADKGHTFALKNPYTGEDTDIKITVVGADSRKYRQARVDAVRASAKSDHTLDSDDFNSIVYSRCIIGWEGVEDEGKAVKLTVDNAEKLLNKYLWMIDQIGEEVEKRANFTQPPKDN